MFKKMHDTGLFGNHILPNPSFMADPLTVNNGIHPCTSGFAEEDPIKVNDVYPF